MSIHSLTQMSVPDGALRAGNIATGVDTTVESPAAQIIARTRQNILEILAVNVQNVQACISEFMELVWTHRDSHGRTNPRVTRTFLHAMLPEVKKLRSFAALTTAEQRCVSKGLSAKLHKPHKKANKE